jgi:hypothetical protein
MSAKALIEVDVRIAALRDLISEKLAPSDAESQLAELLKQRDEILSKILSTNQNFDPSLEKS